MAVSRKSRGWLKVAAVAVLVVVGYDVIKQKGLGGVTNIGATTGKTW
ncbi:MAG: hypothetical protein ACYDDZ_10925 [Acidimicrobiales bacterium]